MVNYVRCFKYVHLLVLFVVVVVVAVVVVVVVGVVLVVVLVVVAVGLSSLIFWMKQKNPSVHVETPKPPVVATDHQVSKQPENSRWQFDFLDWPWHNRKRRSLDLSVFRGDHVYVIVQQNLQHDLFAEFGLLVYSDALCIVYTYLGKLLCFLDRDYCQGETSHMVVPFASGGEVTLTFLVSHWWWFSWLSRQQIQGEGHDHGWSHVKPLEGHRWSWRLSETNLDGWGSR